MPRHRHSPLFSGGLVASIILLGGTLAAAPGAQAFDFKGLMNTGADILERQLQKERRAEEEQRRREEKLRAEEERQRREAERRGGTEQRTSPASPASPSQRAAPAQSPSSGMVSEAQRGLNKLGYDAGPVDGAMGRRTRDAVRSFQRDQGRSIDGQIDITLLRLLEAAVFRAENGSLQKQAGTAAAAPKRAGGSQPGASNEGAEPSAVAQKKDYPARAAAASGDASTAQSAAGAHFHIEGIRLGMTGAQIAAVLREKGYTSSNDAKSRELPPPEKFSKGEARDRLKIRVEYERAEIRHKVAPLPRDQWPVKKIILALGRGGLDEDAEVEQLLRSLVAKYGKANKCGGGRDPAHPVRCTWIRSSNGGQETLLWQMGMGSSSLSLKGTNVPPAKPSDAPADRSVASDRTDRGRAAHTAAEPPKVDDAPQARPLVVATEVEQSGRLHIAGATLGMTEGEIADALKKNGFEHHPSASHQFKRESGQNLEIHIRYSDRLPSGHVRYDAERKAIRIDRTFALLRTKEEREKFFDSLVTRFGEPRCRKKGHLRVRCTWVQQWNGQTEELRWSEKAILPQLSLTYDDNQPQ